MNQEKKKLTLAIIVLILAGIAPNLFPVAEAGISQLSTLAIKYLLPSVVLIVLVIFLTHLLKYQVLKKQIIYGILAGLAGTVGLEIVREIGYRLGGMPGELSKLMGVLLLNQFATGPGLGSDIAGWAYHFWNGAAFGIIFSVVIGRGKTWMGVIYGMLLGIGFMVSPVTRALGIGAFGFNFKDGYQFIITVTLAHISFGAILGWLVYLKNKEVPNNLTRIKSSFFKARVEFSH